MYIFSIELERPPGVSSTITAASKSSSFARSSSETTKSAVIGVDVVVELDREDARPLLLGTDGGRREHEAGEDERDAET